MRQHLFLFAHQDDETPVFLEIETLCAQGDRVMAVYLTSGTLDGSPSPRRNAESRWVLERLGVAPEDIAFLGDTHQLPDGRLPEHLPQARTALLEWLRDKGPIAQLFCLAWEGGHQDHDAVYALAVELHTEHGIGEQAFQFPYYHGKGWPGSWFKVLDPIHENGPPSGAAYRGRLGWVICACASALTPVKSNHGLGWGHSSFGITCSMAHKFCTPYKRSGSKKNPTQAPCCTSVGGFTILTGCENTWIFKTLASSPLNQSMGHAQQPRRSNTGVNWQQATGHQALGPKQNLLSGRLGLLHGVGVH